MAAPDKEAAVLVEVIDNEEDFTEVYRCISEAFGRQINDGIWTAFNPGWDTPEGQAAGAVRLVQRWRSVATDNKGNPSTVFLKATLPDDGGGSRRAIVGFAIWVQATAVEGHGYIVSDDTKMDFEALYPGNEREQRFLRQMLHSLIKRRVEFVKGKAAAAADPPAVMALDLCATHPAFQRRGAATKLVQWGLDEARRRGIPDATTEASSMGRHAYAKLGFEYQGSDIVYEVDDEFSDRDKPSNVFMLYSRSVE
ncbi:acyl-CoA N-acyltransferase [Xylaria cf. heliscus]|nr:acyl-CoA N-acyltransferase [Xylaria cf. heliscus]